MTLNFYLKLMLASLLSGMLAWGQFDSGQISGFVKDESDATIAGATVTVVNEGNRDQRQTTTNAGGYYVFPNLPVGKYTVTTEMTGFKKAIQTGVGVNSASKLNLDVQMAVGTCRVGRGDCFDQSGAD